MPVERQSQPKTGFFKFTKKGQSVAGIARRPVTVKAGTADESTFLPMSTCIVFDGESKERYAFVNIGLGTDLRFKIDASCEGKFMAITFTGTEQAKKGSPKKVFRVVEFDDSEADKNAANSLYAGAGTSHKNDAYPVDHVPIPDDIPDGDDEQEDLPF